MDYFMVCWTVLGDGQWTLGNGNGHWGLGIRDWRRALNVGGEVVNWGMVKWN